MENKKDSNSQNITYLIISDYNKEATAPLLSEGE
jgi:hypothetical protein